MSRQDEIEVARSYLLSAVRRQLYECELRGRGSKEYRQACADTDAAANHLRELERPRKPIPTVRSFVETRTQINGGTRMLDALEVKELLALLRELEDESKEPAP